ncbi:putative N-terminal amidase [Triangularia verruculosa]|uniref:N-terminal amidase n=1 Tax=Triangularia verruculosa TaxID=2587418 RepID=A0AAN6XRI9_9PEZI|nr:putative N-terminal amidase [Triangularia verruculosa]
MRIACLQFSPQVGEVTENTSKADAVLAASAPELEDGIDLLVLPEMSFSGYNFRSQQHILPYLESPSTGPSSSWAKHKAQSLNCTVAVGYPELYSHTDKEYYNSLLVINPAGNQIANYRKSFLYYTDTTWAKEGSGFYSDTTSQICPGKKTAMGICMDINPYNFTNPWDLYEFARHCLTVKANLVIMSMAWLTLEMRERFLTGREQQPDMETLAYWVGRLEPLIRQGGGHDDDEEIILVFANRCGWEDEAVYAGSSAVMGVKGGEVSVYGVLGRGVEECLVVDTDAEPMGRLVTKKKKSDTDEEEETSSPENQHEHDNADEKPTPGSTQPSNNSSTANPPQQPPLPSSSNPTQHHHRPKLTLQTDPLTIPPFKSHHPHNLSLPTTTPPYLYSPSPSPSPSPYNSPPFRSIHLTTPSPPTSFPVSFSPSFCSPSSPHSLSSLENDLDPHSYFEAWLVSPVENNRQPKEKQKLLLWGYQEEERLHSWKWSSDAAVREVVDHDHDQEEDVSPLTTTAAAAAAAKKEEMGEGEMMMLKVMASPSIFADLNLKNYWERMERGVEVQ